MLGISTMAQQWDDNVPIYLQVRDQTVFMIMDNSLKPGDSLPSVRNAATDLQINPLTVSKAYQQLVDEGLVEKRRGLGMFVCEGARERARREEQEKFLKEDWPAALERAQRLGLSLETLMKRAQKREDQ